MYAQLLTRLSTGACSARTPLLSCASRFSWLQRSLAALHRQILPHHYHPVGLPAPRG
jgi:hypothetical protein